MQYVSSENLTVDNIKNIVQQSLNSNQVGKGNNTILSK